MEKYSKESKILITIFGGWFGLHYYLDKNYKKGILYTLTMGIFYVGWIIDIINVVKGKTVYKNTEQRSTNAIENINVQKPTKNISKEESSLLNTDNDLAIEYKNKKTLDMPKDYVVLDVETTGLDFNNDRIIELSAIKYKNDKEIEKFSQLINPQMKISKTITRITGITNEDLMNMPTINDVLPNFITFINDYTLVAHNASFDYKMISAECIRCNLNIISNRICDTLTLSKKYYTNSEVNNYKLETFKNYFQLDYQSHRALSDCYTCAYLYQQCSKKYEQSMPDLNDEEIRALEIIKDILQKNGQEAFALRGFLMSSNILAISIFNNIFKIKCRGKLRYILFDENVKEDSFDFSNFELVPPAKSEKANFRVKYDDINQLYELDQLIIKEYLRTKSNVEDFIKEFSRGKNHFNDYLLTGYKIQ